MDYNTARDSAYDEARETGEAVLFWTVTIDNKTVRHYALPSQVTAIAGEFDSNNYLL